MPDTSIEFEVKVALQDNNDLSSLLQELCLKEETVGTDVYFDTTKRDLFLRGVFLRLRGQDVLEIKYNPDIADVAHLSCEEHKFLWPLNSPGKQSISRFLGAFLEPHQSAATNPFSVFGLSDFITIIKHRTVYTGESLEISIDKVENLGTFLEIEAKGTDGIRRVQEFCRERGLVNLPIGYVELWLRKHDFVTYRKGRYLLPEDK